VAVGKKIVMLGESGVGKTSLVRRYVLNEFSDEYQTTLGVNIYKHADEAEGRDGEMVAFKHMLWDVEGGLQRQSLLDSYIRGAAGAVIVGDITRDDPLSPMRENAERFRKSRPGRPAVFAVNKSDLVDGPAHLDGALELAEEFRGSVVYTSAATGDDVPRLFRALAGSILQMDA
jgi:small GTP-binding protein